MTSAWNSLLSLRNGNRIKGETSAGKKIRKVGQEREATSL
jgi:hypothetical protein